MPCKRFLKILRFLHFADNEKVDENDKMKKTRNISDFLNNRFVIFYTPTNKVLINESLIKYKGGLHFASLLHPNK